MPATKVLESMYVRTRLDDMRKYQQSDDCDLRQDRLHEHVYFGISVVFLSLTVQGCGSSSLKTTWEYVTFGQFEPGRSTPRAERPTNNEATLIFSYPFVLSLR